MKWATAAVIAFCASAAMADIPPKKKALIQELLKVTEAAEGTGDAILDILGGRLGRPAREEHRHEVRESRHLPALAEKTQLGIYDRYFTEKQLADLIAFFKTPTGRHYVEVAREVAKEARRKLDAEVTRQLEEKTTRDNIVRARAEIRSLALAIDAYRVAHNFYPDAPNIEQLATVLTPTYMAIVPRRDRWGREYVYAVSPDRRSYRVVSRGPDGKLESASTRFDVLPADATAYGDDIVLVDGKFTSVATE